MLSSDHPLPHSQGHWTSWAGGPGQGGDAGHGGETRSCWKKSLFFLTGRPYPPCDEIIFCFALKPPVDRAAALNSRRAVCCFTRRAEQSCLQVFKGAAVSFLGSRPFPWSIQRKYHSFRKASLTPGIKLTVPNSPRLPLAWRPVISSLRYLAIIY